MKSFPLLISLLVLAGCASTDSQRFAALDPDVANVTVEPTLVILSIERKATATTSVSDLLEDTRAIEFFNVYGVAGDGSPDSLVVCGNMKSSDPRGGPDKVHPFALSGGRVMLLDEATNWGFINTGSGVVQRHRQRPFVGSWWAACRPQSFQILVKEHQESQRTMQALR